MLAGLGGEHSFGLVAMSFAFAVFLVGVLHGDLLVHEILAVHIGDGRVGGLKVPERHEPVALGEVVIIARDLCRLVESFDQDPGKEACLWYVDQITEPAERIVQHLLRHHRIEVSNEELCADLHRLLLIG